MTNGGNSIQTMAADISLLKNEILGPPQPASGEKANESEATSPKGLSQEIKQYLKERRGDEDKLLGLHDSIKMLVQQIRDENAQRSPERKWKMYVSTII